MGLGRERACTGGTDASDHCNQGALCVRRPVHVADGGQSAAVGDTFSVVLKTDNTLWAWGSDVSGELGNATASGSNTSAPVQVAGLPTVRAISAGHQHALGIATPRVSVSTDRIDLGQQVVGSSGGAQSITIGNDGSAPFNAPLLVSVNLNGPDAAHFSKTADTCSGVSIAAGASCEVDIAFGPSSTGSKSASVTLADNSLVGSHTVTLVGEALPPPAPIDDTPQGDE